MQFWSKFLVATVFLGLVGGTQVQASRAKHLHATGLKGKIVSVAADGSSIVIARSKKKGGQETIQIAANPSVTIDGIGGKHVSDLQAGEMVVLNPTSGSATTIIAKHPHQKKTKAT